MRQDPLRQAAQAALEVLGNPPDHFPYGEWDRRIQALRAALAAEPTAQPVAWISEIQCIGPQYGKKIYDALPVQSLQPGYYKHTPLYAAPAQAAEPALNLACKSVQSRLAAQWGYVPADSESVRAAQDDAYVCGRNEERARCAKLCLRPAGWLSDSQRVLADEIRSAILGTSA